MKRQKLDHHLPTVVRESLLGWLTPKDLGRWRSTCRAFAKDLAAFPVIYFGSQMYLPARVETILINSRCDKFDHLPNLKEIHCRGDEFTDQMLAQTNKCPLLHTLKIGKGSNLTDAGMAHLSFLDNLKVLEFGGAALLTDASFAQLPPVEHLSVWWCKKITHVGVCHIFSMESLVKLELITMRGVPECFDKLSLLRNLRHLTVCDCPWLVDAGFEQIANLSELRELEVSSCTWVTSEGLQHIARLLKLEKLLLADMRVADDTLACIAQCVGLRLFSLERCFSVTERGFNHVAQLSNLEHFSLEHCSITDAGLLGLKSLPKLHTLNLRWCHHITPLGLEHVSHVTNLEVAQCDQICTED